MNDNTPNPTPTAMPPSPTPSAMPLQRPTPTPEVAAKQLDAIALHAEKNERLSWTRNYKKLQGLVTELAPYEEKMLELILAKQNIVDEIAVLRESMVKICVHPKDSLAHHDTYAECRFCNRKISLPAVTLTDE